MDEINQELTFEVRDEFDRKKIAEKIITLLLSDLEVSPMVIDGEWGSGKTEFVRKMVHLLKQNHKSVRVAYIDAFKADHADQPLVTLIANISNLIDGNEPREEFINKAIPAVKYGLKAITKAGIAWTFRQSSETLTDEFQQAIKTAGEDALSWTIDTLIKEHQEVERNIALLRSALDEITQKHKVIIFIDELDRCKPTFSISMIENIKHIFDVPNVKFVLSANLTQLHKAIEYNYGLESDAKRYLDKFIKYKLNLSEQFTTDQYNYVQASVHHCENLISTSESLKETSIVYPVHIQLVNRLVEVNNLSLREVQSFVKHLEIYSLLTSQKGLNHVNAGNILLRIMGVYLFCFEQEICKQLDRGIIDGPVLGNLLNIHEYKVADDIQYADSAHVVSTMIFLESSTPVEGFEPSDQEMISAWETRFRDYFNRGGMPPERGHRVNVITNAIRTLKLL